jgi:hypothetical protein
MKPLALLVLVVACGKSPDACERAMARLDRIAKPSPLRPTAETNREILAQCRRGTHDPVVWCALDAASDEAAASCVEAFIDRVLKPSSGSGGGSGLNPLFEPIH